MYERIQTMEKGVSAKVVAPELGILLVQSSFVNVHFNKINDEKCQQ